ncbi:MAG: HAD-IA family hydrolase [Burkholderiaceae bacterium]
MERAAFDTVLLDAMGVIYASGDDVGELLIPFLRENGVDAPQADIEHAYREASLGRFSSSRFWQRFGLDAGVEDRYLARHTLHPGLPAFLERLPDRIRLACLSNDVSEWSRKLRDRFGLTSRIVHWTISGDVGLRKPDPAIYELVKAVCVEPARTLFVDDRLANVEAARASGFEAVLFGSGDGSAGTARTFDDVLLKVRTGTVV